MAFMVLTNHFAKAFTNKTSGTKMTWWKTSFNMPVRNIFDNNSTYTETEGMLNATGEATSFDLSGFEAWWEVISASSVYTLYGPFAGGTINLTQTWKNPGGTTIFSNGPVAVSFPSLSAASWGSYQLASNQWVASWEIAASGTYSLDMVATGAYTDTVNFPVTFTNVPSVSTYTTGMMWIEWNNLRWSSANWHLHTMVGTAVANPAATPWFLWIEWNYIYWIGSDWQKYRWQYNFQQFGSAFSNWPSPATVSWETAGMIWMDSNFWYEHIGYIASDWTKWINNSWDNPYV